MNQIRAIQKLNQREIELGISPEASWHTDYRDTAFVNFGGLPYELTEGDIITIFSQYGEPVFLKLARDKESGKSKGFGWLKYEDQRSCDLAVDNIGGAEIGGRLIRVDHARYKARDDEDPEECKIGWEDMIRREKMAKGEDIEMEDEQSEAEQVTRRPMIKEEEELQKLIDEHDEEDPMKAFLIEEKKAEVELALQKARSRKDKGSDAKHRHREHRQRSHRSRRDRSGDRDSREDRHRRSHRDKTPVLDRDSRQDRARTPEKRDETRDHDRRRRDDDVHDRDRRSHRPRDEERERDRHEDRRKVRPERHGDEKRSSRRDSRDRRREGDDDRERDRRQKSRRDSRSRSPRR
ncbi:uncharacterized protein B0I36DRAFT_283214 [Microdochium trichocladiopsis]|uniref:RRM domain-containing protein n=1 Tax=Microdochium trichocladiopsis TaxID=1682393 RepID=A0A9P8YE12_9PEZI|nr:uncharacterized protein B0I36DRAFT_283214 [Microdochium trichocladiopsis]KAH7037519.1 hypothetical protein B0I36DRAFT_283214 [Microdochium trichocladiopsis]